MTIYVPLFWAGDSLGLLTGVLLSGIIVWRLAVVYNRKKEIPNAKHSAPDLERKDP